jgi:hypothetical protein
MQLSFHYCAEFQFVFIFPIGNNHLWNRVPAVGGVILEKCQNGCLARKTVTEIPGCPVIFKKE